MMLMFPFCNAAHSAGSDFSEVWGLPSPWQTALRFQAGVPGLPPWPGCIRNLLATGEAQQANGIPVR